MEQLFEFIKEYWELAVAIVSVIGLLIGFILQRWRWSSRWFDRIINVSVNFIEQDSQGKKILKFRSLRDDATETVFLSEFAANLVAKAAKATTIENPFIKDLKKGDLDILLRAIQGAISERFPEGIVHKAAGFPVKGTGIPDWNHG